MNLGYLAAMVGRNWPKTVGLPWRYFASRGCLLDCRGPLVIDRTSQWGVCVQVVTESHDIGEGPGKLGPIVPRGVCVGAGAWICSFSVLTGCRIGAGSIVAAGSVVRGQNVAPGVIVAGNPARVVARWDGAAWVYESPEVCGYARELA